jgi:regulator of sigma E protease
MEFMSSLFYFIVVISVLVVIHEFGHFIAARLNKIRVDIFSVGMGYRILGWNKKTGFGFGKLPEDWESEGFTDYRLSVFPIGGYVKLAGMIDESMDTDFVESEPQPWEFRSKNTWQKAIVMSAGVIMNFILAVMIYGGIIYFEGKDKYQTTEIGYVQKGSVAEKLDLRQGDKILEINGIEIKAWDELIEQLTLSEFGSSRRIKMLRNNQIQNIEIDGKKIIVALEAQLPLGIHPGEVRVFVINADAVMPAGKAGITSGDTIIRINNTDINSMYQLVEMIKENPQKALFIEWKRDAGILSDTLFPTEDGLIGIQHTQQYVGALVKESYGIIPSIVYGFNESIRIIELFVGTIVQIFEGNLSVKKSLGGPILIAQMASQQADMGIKNFLFFMAMLSVTLAVINILPFPALDGGHLLMLLIEAVIRREVPLKVKMIVQQAGMVILLLLMVFIFYNDILRIFE